MLLHDGRRVPLARLEHVGGGDRRTDRAVEQISVRVATLNRMLAATREDR